MSIDDFRFFTQTRPHKGQAFSVYRGRAKRPALLAALSVAAVVVLAGVVL